MFHSWNSIDEELISIGHYSMIYLQAQISRKPTTPISQSLWQTHLQCRLLYRSPRHSSLSRSCKIRFSVSRNKFLQEIRNAFLGSGANARMRTYGTLDRRILGLYLPVISQHFLHIFDSENPERFFKRNNSQIHHATSTQNSFFL